MIAFQDTVCIIFFKQGKPEIHFVSDLQRFTAFFFKELTILNFIEMCFYSSFATIY